MRAIIAAVAAAFALSACHAVQFETGRPASARRYEKTVHFFLWGFVGEPTIDLDVACPEGVARFGSRAPPHYWLAEVATLGAWSPRRVVVECVEASP